MNENTRLEDNGDGDGKIIVFASAKGGVGKTITSVNIATSLATKGYSTCILDGSFQFGDVNLALDLKPNLTISDLIQDIKVINNGSISNYLLSHNSGVKVLSAPAKPEYADLINSEGILSVVNSLIKEFSYLIIDLAAGLTEHNVTFMELSNKIYIITDLEMASLKNTKMMIKTLKQLGLADKIIVVVNRGNMESVIKFKDVYSILEIEDILSIPNDFKIVSKSFNMGIPFVLSKPDEKISREITFIVNKICDKKLSNRVKRRKKSGFFNFVRFSKA